MLLMIMLNSSSTTCTGNSNWQIVSAMLLRYCQIIFNIFFPYRLIFRLDYLRISRESFSLIFLLDLRLITFVINVNADYFSHIYQFAGISGRFFCIVCKKLIIFACRVVDMCSVHDI